MTQFKFTRISGNSKTGPIPVTVTSSDSCPSHCPLKKSGCYAELGMVGMHWRNLDSGKGNVFTDEQLFGAIKSLSKGQLWRHNIAGDLVHDNGAIDAGFIAGMIEANKNKSGFTYTHHNPDIGNNSALIRAANIQGFTINLSANSPDHADELAELNIGPVVTLLPIDAPKLTYTNKGRAIVKCPAVDNESVNCSNCGLCANPNRKSIVGFPVHGSAKKKAQKVISIHSIKG